MGIKFGIGSNDYPSSWKEMKYKQLVKVRDEFLRSDSTEDAIVVLRENFTDHVFERARYGEWISVDGHKITVWVWEHMSNREDVWNKISHALACVEGSSGTII